MHISVDFLLFEDVERQKITPFLVPATIYCELLKNVGSISNQILIVTTFSFETHKYNSYSRLYNSKSHLYNS